MCLSSCGEGSRAGSPRKVFPRLGECKALAGEAAENISYQNDAEMVQSQAWLDQRGWLAARRAGRRVLLGPLATSTLEAAGTECHATRFLHLVLTGKRTGCSARLGFANAGEDTRLQTIYICSKKSSLKRSCFPKNIFYEIGVKWSKMQKTSITLLHQDDHYQQDGVMTLDFCLPFSIFLFF